MSNSRIERTASGRARVLRRGLTGVAAAGAVALAGAGAALGTGSAPAPHGMVRVGGAAPHPAGSQVVMGALSRANSELARQMAVTVVLEPRNAAQLAAYAQEVSQPGSAVYHQFLTAAQFRARYAPAAATIATVRTALQHTGLTVRGVTGNDLGIRLTGSEAQVEQAFKINFEQLRLANGRQALVNAQAPAVTSAIAPQVEAVVGLNGLETPTTSYVQDGMHQSMAASLRPVDGTQPRTGGPVACKAAVAAEKSRKKDSYTRGEYTAAQIAHYYSMGELYRQHDLGQGVTVALYELELNASSDIAAYQKCYRTHTKITYINVDGGVGRAAAKNDPDGAGEAALDVEQFISLSPKVHVLVYRGPNASNGRPGSGPYDVYATIIGQDRASIVSTSWGECEPLETYSDAAADEKLFEEAAVQGQTVTAAAGDDGSEDCTGYMRGAPHTRTVDDPGSDPYVISAGGTSLNLTTRTPREVVWNNSTGAGGGGVSQFWKMPSFQSSAPSSLGVINSYSGAQSGCTAASGWCREVPDITGSADPVHGYLNYYNGNGKADTRKFHNRGWIGVGGTSAVAPLWSAIFALTEASKACDGHRLGLVTPALYKLAGESQAGYFHDITSGNNDWTKKGGGLFPAAVGFDMASGLGSPRVPKLAPALCRARVVDPR